MYNAEDYNPNLEVQYLRARYYDVEREDFLTEDTYLGNLTDPLTLNRYNYVKSSAPNYVDPSGHTADTILDVASAVRSAERLMSDPSWTNAGFLLWDIGAAIIPLAPMLLREESLLESLLIH